MGHGRHVDRNVRCDRRSRRIVAVAAAVRAIAGSGFTLLAVPLLALAMPVITAVVVGSIASLAMSIVTASLEPGHVRWRTAWFIVAVAVLGLPLGLYLLIVLPAAALTARVGDTVLVSTILVWRRPTLRDGRITLSAIGLLVGELTTTTGTNGPPLVAAFQSWGTANASSAPPSPPRSSVVESSSDFSCPTAS
jgi:uncharacterized membrane protein YfcA